MRICVYGAGSVGGFIGGMLAESGQEVSLVARGEHLAALRSNGLTVETGGRTLKHRLPASDKPGDLGKQDYVIVTVKAPALPSVVRDIGALLDTLAADTNVDSSRIAVIGGSYGGYMVLTCMTHFNDRFRCGIDIVGISNFVSFLENTESYRRDLRRVEYGDERDPEMRAFLTRISPLTHAAKITKPLFVVQGRNDPRVPWTEAEQIVREARASGAKVWYLLAENEGHGFQRKENADYLFYAMTMFMRETLLK
jgi:dienelactone hydrolase